MQPGARWSPGVGCAVLYMEALGDPSSSEGLQVLPGHTPPVSASVVTWPSPLVSQISLCHSLFF